MSCDIKLKENGLRITPQRRLILDAIHESGSHLTGKDILERVQARVSGVNKSTVYRTLDLLEQLGCVYKSEDGDQFIYHHAEEGHHHHIVCHSCGKTVECDEAIFTPIEQAIKKAYGFSVDFKHVMMSGLCKKCQKKSGQ
jgi:Fur family ferric uptake transcriptional regulator